MSKRLTWTWCIATYKRHEMLKIAFRAAAASTRPPSEAVIVDASPNWQEGKKLIAQEVNELRSLLGENFCLTYVAAQRPSSAAQRNEAIALAKGDILFLIDDDSLLYPDCAEKLLEVYEADGAENIQAVVPLHVVERPQVQGFETDGKSLPRIGAVSEYGTISTWVRAALKADDRFVPYDQDYPTHLLPAELDKFQLASRQVVAGYCLTCRREAAIREPFESRFEKYSPGEDSDMTYRMTRHGPVVARLDAKICHLEAAGARLDEYSRTALGAINPLLMHRIHTSNLALSKKRNRDLLLRRIAVEMLKDLRDRKATLPKARGILYALRQMNQIFNCPDAEFDSLFVDPRRPTSGKSSGLNAASSA